MRATVLPKAIILTKAHRATVSIFALFTDEPEVFLAEYFQTAIFHPAHFWRVVNLGYPTP